MAYPDNISDSNLGSLCRLSRYIYSSSNMLARRSNNEIIPYTIGEIQKILEMKDTKFKNFKKATMVDNIFLKKSTVINDTKKITSYYFNPIYFNSTNYISLELYMLFEEELKSYLPDWVVEKYLNWMEEQ